MQTMKGRKKQPPKPADAKCKVTPNPFPKDSGFDVKVSGGTPPYKLSVMVIRRNPGQPGIEIWMALEHKHVSGNDVFIDTSEMELEPGDEVIVFIKDATGAAWGATTFAQ
jgi:hypothetical protein